MIFNSVSSFSLFFILLLSFIFSFFLYFYREKRLQELSINIRIFLFSLRFLSFFLILFLILNPFIENKKEIIEKPILVVFQDNSSSIISNSDSLFYKNSYKEIIENFKFKVKEKFNNFLNSIEKIISPFINIKSSPSLKLDVYKSIACLILFLSLRVK